MDGKYNSKIDVKFRERIKEIISEMGSAEELSRRSGVSGRAIGSYKLGESDPSRKNLIAIAKAANVELEWLATGEGTKRKEKTESLTRDATIPYETRTDPFIKAVSDLKAIFDTGDRDIIETLMANLNTYKRASLREKEIIGLTHKIDILEKRIAALEESLRKEKKAESPSGTVSDGAAT